jgi:hypothetical protein
MMIYNGDYWERKCGIKYFFSNNKLEIKKNNNVNEEWKMR